MKWYIMQVIHFNSITGHLEIVNDMHGLQPTLSRMAHGHLQFLDLYVGTHYRHL